MYNVAQQNWFVLTVEFDWTSQFWFVFRPGFLNVNFLCLCITLTSCCTIEKRDQTDANSVSVPVKLRKREGARSMDILAEENSV